MNSMKPRTPKSVRPNGHTAGASSILSTDRALDTAQQLAETQQALNKAREQIDEEVQRRQTAQQGFEQFVRLERERLRKQLHDGLGQALTSVSFLASSLRSRLRKSGSNEADEMDEIIQLINQAIAESRAIAATCDNAPRSSAAQVTN